MSNPITQFTAELGDFTVLYTGWTGAADVDLTVQITSARVAPPKASLPVECAAVVRGVPGLLRYSRSASGSGSAARGPHTSIPFTVKIREGLVHSVACPGAPETELITCCLMALEQTNALRATSIAAVEVLLEALCLQMYIRIPLPADTSQTRAGVPTCPHGHVFRSLQTVVDETLVPFHPDPDQCACARIWPIEALHVLTLANRMLASVSMSGSWTCSAESNAAKTVATPITGVYNVDSQEPVRFVKLIFTDQGNAQRRVHMFVRSLPTHFNRHQLTDHGGGLAHSALDLTAAFEYGKREFRHERRSDNIVRFPLVGFSYTSGENNPTPKGLVTVPLSQLRQVPVSVHLQRAMARLLLNYTMEGT